MGLMLCEKSYKEMTCESQSMNSYCLRTVLCVQLVQPVGLGQIFSKLVLRNDTNLGEQKIQSKPKLETTEAKGSFSIDSSGI